MPFTIKPYNVIDRSDLKEITVDRIPAVGDTLEVDSDLYLVCDIHNVVNDCTQAVGVIPIVYKTENKAFNTENYLESLYVALKRMQDMRMAKFFSHN